VVPPHEAPQVSPLAVSNVNSQRGAFSAAAPSAAAVLGAGERTLPEATDPGSPGAGPGASSAAGTSGSSSTNKRVAGTQLMPSTANPALGIAAAASSAPPAPTTAKRQDKTQLLGAFPPSVKGGPASAVGPSQPQPAQPPANPANVAPGSAVGPLPGSGVGPAPASIGGPMASTPYAPAPGPAPGSVAHPQPPPPSHMQAPMAPHGQPPMGGVPYGQPQPQPHSGFGAPQSAWGAPAPAPYAAPLAPYAPHAPHAPHAPAMPAAPAYGGGYGFGYPPGTRVQVTWSNGQRYPATVQQISGTQCLVLFPDGQQHWVEMQYVAPG